MDRRKIALALTLVLGLGFLYRGLHRSPHGVAAQLVAELATPKTDSQVVAFSPGVYSSYKERDLMADREQKEIAEVSPTAPKGFERRLNLFRKYSRKVLKTEGEVRLLHALVEDDATQSAALAALRPGVDENERIVIVDYVLAGLEAQRSLGHSALRDKVIAFLQSDLPHDLEKKTIKSLAGDRIELFAALKQIDPRAADQLMSAPKSELNKRIYQYAMMNYGKKGS